MLIPNLDSNAVFELKNDAELLPIMTKMYTNIDFELLQTFYNKYLEINKINENSLEDFYSKTLSELKNSIKYQNKELTSQTGNQLSILQKALDLKTLINQNFTEKTKFYLPWKYDFRGRTYFFSDISFTFNKEFRWCMFIGYHGNENDLVPKWHPYNQKIYSILNQHIDTIDSSKIKIYNESNIYTKYIIIFLLISLGEINKVKLGTIVSLKNFLEEGIKVYKQNDINKYDYENQIKIISIRKTIKDFENDFNNGTIKKRLLSKDAPASVFQHLTINFGWKDKNLLKWCNLNSNDNWYDTYSFFIDKWKNQIDNENELKLINDFFNRKSLKKSIMTFNYGIGIVSAKKDFKKILIKLNETNPKTIEKIENNWKTIENLFESFFEFLSSLSLLKKSPEEIIEYIDENEGIIELVDAVVDAKYYSKTETYTIDFQNEKKRYTKYYTVLSEKTDDKKYKISLRANYIQSLDSALTRWIILKHPFYTIHDCFLIEYSNIIYFMSLINEGMNQKFHDFHNTWEKEKTEIFSIFIVL